MTVTWTPTIDKAVRFTKAAATPVFALAAVIGAFLLRFEFSIPATEQHSLRIALLVYIPLRTLIFYISGIHRTWWRNAGVHDAFRLVSVSVIGSVICALVTYLVAGPSFPRSVYILEPILWFMAIAGLIFAVRLVREVFISEAQSATKTKQVLIYGAGSAGLTLAKELRMNRRLATRVVGFLDDDRAKLGVTLAGIPILGKGLFASSIVAELRQRGTPVSDIIIAMPSATGAQMRAAVANCREADVAVRTVPGLGELLNGKVTTGQIREVSVNDLLGREPVEIDEAAIGHEIKGKSVLVTGGCGSIGSELCRQLARFKPRKLVLFDQAESDLFMLAIELRKVFPDLDIIEEIGDICSRPRVDEVMSLNRIDAAFHAAAYKHVPMMEANVVEAAHNNIVGTWNVAQAAHDHKVGKFLMISSDKAVNPTSMMGVTKRIAELLLGAMGSEGGAGTSFVSVRFGNVLASKGSVVPIFQRQIAEGGPITITHPEMRRYFMSIPEAVQLVLQAFAMGKGTEIFVLDMGEPVRIMDLAVNMISLAGLTPNEDIEIKITGLRPGEKLFEELNSDSDDIVPTYHPKIKIFRSQTPGKRVLAHWLDELGLLLADRNPDRVRAHLLRVVPEYCGQKPAVAPGEERTMAAAAGSNGRA